MRFPGAITVSLIVVLTGMLDSVESEKYSADNRSMRIFEFELRGAPETENFIAVTSDPETIATCEAELDLPVSQRNLHINGTLDYGNGGHNFNWSWHFVPGQWVLTPISVELCDGVPSFVESDLQYWIEDIGYFCPWSSHVLREIDHFCGDANSDLTVDGSDAVFLINFAFAGGPAPDPIESGDSNCDSSVDVSDAVYIINFSFAGGNEPCDPDGDGSFDC